MELKRLYSVSIKNEGSEIHGILLTEGEEWLLMRFIYTDYMIGGMMLIWKKCISALNRGEREIFIEKVLKESNKWDTSIVFNIPLDHSIDLYNYFKEEQMVIQLYTRKKSIYYMGKISRVLKKSFYLEPMNPKGEWLDGDIRFQFDNIIKIEIDTDYINSLLAYNRYTSKTKIH